MTEKRIMQNHRDQLNKDQRDHTRISTACPSWCTHPEREGRSCRGCERSMNPRLFDGGCKNLLDADH